MECLGPGGHNVFLRRQVELNPGGEGDGGGLSLDGNNREATGRNDWLYLYIQWRAVVLLLKHEVLIGWERKGRGLQWPCGNLETDWLNICFSYIYSRGGIAGIAVIPIKGHVGSQYPPSIILDDLEGTNGRYLCYQGGNRCRVALMDSTGCKGLSLKALWNSAFSFSASF